MVLRDLIAAQFSDRVSATLLINFELICLGRPFPYEELRHFDVVIYSPIENKGAYNTTYLVEACRALGVETICFPWLEWHGYCPGATKGDFGGRHQWHFPTLVEAAAGFERFSDFAEWAIASFPDDMTIDAGLARSTKKIRSAEQRHDMPVRIADFVVEHYRRSRLFLVSDHPSLAVYIHVLRQILALVGIAEGAACERLLSAGREPQWGHRTPVFPRVASRLALRFSDPYWVDEDILQGCSRGLHDYLRLYFDGSTANLGSHAGAAPSPLATHRVEPVANRVPHPRAVPYADDTALIDRETHR